MKNDFPSRAKTKVKPRKKPIKKKIFPRKKPPFCPECKGNGFNGHEETCPQYWCQHHCCNNLEDCDPVAKKYDHCDVCNGIWDKVVDLRIDNDNPHLPTVFEEAAEKFVDEHGRRFRTQLYSFGVELLNYEFIYNNFGDDNYWNFKFKVNKK